MAQCSLTAESSKRKREKDATTYKYGCFGSELSSSDSKEVTSSILLVVNKDDTEICEKCGMHDCPVLRDQKNDDWVGCCDFCESWYHTGYEDVWLEDIGDDPYIWKCEQEWNKV